MSKSSCLSETEVREQREKEVLDTATQFLREVAVNLCALEGVGGKVDIAFKIDRRLLVAKALRRVADELDQPLKRL